METLKKLVFVMIVAAFAAPWAFAQAAASSASSSSSSSASSSSSSSNSTLIDKTNQSTKVGIGIGIQTGDTNVKTGPTTATGGNAAGGSSNATLNNQVPRDFITATPGAVGTSIIPGIPLLGQNWQPLPESATKTVFTVNEIEFLRRQYHGKKEVFAVAFNPRAIAENRDPIHLVPSVTDSNQIVGRVLVNECPDNLEMCLGVALDEAKKKTHTRNVVVLTEDDLESSSKAQSFGLGGVSSGIPGSEAITGSAAGGVFFGKNGSRVDKRKNLMVICLDDRPTLTQISQPRYETPAPSTPPPPETTPDQPPAPPPSEAERPEVPPPTTQTQPALEPPPPAIVPPPVQQTDLCDGLSEFVVFFDYNRSLVKSEYQGWIPRFGSWLKRHPGCKVELIGHACVTGSPEGDAWIGLERARNVYLAFRKYDPTLTDNHNGRETAQIFEYLSAGRDWPFRDGKNEAEQAINRSVVIRRADPKTSMPDKYLQPGRPPSTKDSAISNPERSSHVEPDGARYSTPPPARQTPAYYPQAPANRPSASQHYEQPTYQKYPEYRQTVPVQYQPARTIGYGNGNSSQYQQQPTSCAPHKVPETGDTVSRGCPRQ
jgi:outer membrane protein OmpA-like peptidoglycan-associated protein